MSTMTIDYRKPRAIVVTTVFVVIVVLAGAVIGLNTLPDAWYAGLAKAPWNPPNWIFGPVWLTLYVLIGIAGARAFLRDAASSATMIWGLQMVLNWLWSPVWFRLHQPWIAFALIVAILVLALAFVWRSARDGDRVSAWLFVPYALWVAFASSLNLAIAVLN